MSPYIDSAGYAHFCAHGGTEVAVSVLGWKLDTLPDDIVRSIRQHYIAFGGDVHVLAGELYEPLRQWKLAVDYADAERFA